LQSLGTSAQPPSIGSLTAKHFIKICEQANKLGVNWFSGKVPEVSS